MKLSCIINGNLLCFALDSQKELLSNLGNKGYKGYKVTDGGVGARVMTEFRNSKNSFIIIEVETKNKSTFKDLEKIISAIIEETYFKTNNESSRYFNHG